MSAWNIGWHRNTPTWRVLLPHGWLILISAENNRGPLPARRDVQDARQTFVGTLHPQTVEVNARQLGTVFAATGDDALYPRVT